MSGYIERECHLFYEDSRSNKEYHLKIETTAVVYRYKVIAEFGPRHGTLTYVDKTKGKPVNWDDALEIFEKTEREKRNKGYKDIEDYAKLINYLKTNAIAGYVSDYQWKQIAKAATEYFEGQ